MISKDYNYIKQIEKSATQYNAKEILPASIEALRNALPFLIEALEQYRINPQTNNQFQVNLRKFIDDGQLNTTIIASIAQSFSMTHNDLKEKPIVGLAQEIGKIMGDIEMIFYHYEHMMEHMVFLEAVIKHHFPESK